MKYKYVNEEVTLECELDYSAEKLGEPEDMVLISALANGMEMYEVLAEWVVEDIECSALLAMDNGHD